MSVPFSPKARNGILFVLSAPSGGGKSTLYHGLRATPDFVYSISCTTRKPRPGEVEGSDYYFLSHAEFERRIAEGDFLEYAEVHGNYYGTPRNLVLDQLRAGVDVLVDIDVQGAAQIRANPHPEIANALADVFLMPPGIDELRRRLEARGTETEAQIATRLANAEREMAEWHRYRYVVTGTIEEVLLGFRSIMSAERLASRRMLPPPASPDSASSASL